MVNDYELVRSDRRTVSVQVAEDGRVTVRAPRRMPKRDIEAFLDEKSEWIARAREKQAERRPAAHLYAEGELFLYMGRQLTLTVADRTCVDGELLLAAAPMEKSVRKWYAAEAERILPEAVARQAALIGVALPPVRLSNARTLWGSCAPDGTVRLNRRLIMAPAAIQDYVALHELCHLTRRDHSAAFWALVGGYMPDWKARRDWLKRNGRQLTLD